MNELRSVFMRAIGAPNQKILLAFRKERDAVNLRQRLYRYRDKIRSDPSDALNLLVDKLHFELSDKGVLIKFETASEFKIIEPEDNRDET